MRPMLNAKSVHRSAPNLSTNDGTLFRPDSKGSEYEYEVVSDADPKPPSPTSLRLPKVTRLQLSIPEELKNSLRKIADPWSPTSKPRPRRGRTRALEAYLRDSASSPTHSRWMSRIGVSIQWKTSSLTVKRGTASTSPVRWHFAAIGQYSVAGGQRLQGRRLE